MQTVSPARIIEVVVIRRWLQPIEYEPPSETEMVAGRERPVPPMVMTLASLRYLGADSSVMPPVGQKLTCGSGEARAAR